MKLLQGTELSQKHCQKQAKIFAACSLIPRSKQLHFVLLSRTNENPPVHTAQIHVALVSHMSPSHAQRRTCPKGVNPYPSLEGEPEQQLVDCYCPECSGSLLLGFLGHTTHPIPFDASAELVKYRLEVRIFGYMYWHWWCAKRDNHLFADESSVMSRTVKTL